MSKTKKHTISLSFEYSFDLIGICSHHRDYRLAWNLNDALGLHLIKEEEDFPVYNKKGVIVSYHSRYTYFDEVNKTDFILLKNKSLNQYFVPEKPAIDFFLILNNNLGVDVEELANKLKNVSSILGVYIVDPEEIPSIENIEFD